MANQVHLEVFETRFSHSITKTTQEEYLVMGVWKLSPHNELEVQPDLGVKTQLFQSKEG